METTEPAGGLKRRGMPLFRYFLLVAITAVGIILLLEGFGLRSVFTTYVVVEAETDAVRLADALSDLESQFLLYNDDQEHDARHITEAEAQSLDERMRGFLSNFNVVKIKVFDSSMRIVYSTDRTIIGTVDSDNSKLKAALGGRVMSNFETKDHVWDLDTEYRHDVDIVETYVPVYGSKGDIVGSFEIYKDVTNDLAAAGSMLARGLAVLTFVLVMVTTAMCGLMYIASRTIDRHQIDLWASEARTRLIVEKAADAIATVNENWVIESFNTAAEKIFGYPSSEIIGRAFVDLLCPTNGEIREDKIVEFYKDLKANATRTGGVEMTGRRRDGSTFPAWLAATEVRFADEVLCTLIVRDLTEQKRRELLKRGEDLKRAGDMEMVAQLATGVAHELRNPLTAVKLFFQNNKEEALSLGMSIDDLEVVENEIQRMERSLSTFLDFARPSKPQFKRFDLKEVIDRVTILIEGRAASQQVACLKFTPDDGPVTVMGDQDQIQQLLLNLFMNALDMMPYTGTLEVRLNKPMDQQVEIRISDTGPGIQDGVMSRLFEPFVTTKENGTGLGLVISRRIAEGHSGSLTCFNMTDSGACFVLVLPIAQGSRDHSDEA